MLKPTALISAWFLHQQSEKQFYTGQIFINAYLSLTLESFTLILSQHALQAAVIASSDIIQLIFLRVMKAEHNIVPES